MVSIKGESRRKPLSTSCYVAKLVDKMSEEKYKPIIGITMGDAAGIGPEIIVKALNEDEVYEICKPLVLGDAKTMIHAVRQICKFDHIDVRAVKNVKEARFEKGIIDVLDFDNINLSRLVHGRVNPMCGKASFEYVSKAIELALNGEIDAIATAPLHKEAMNLAGYHYAGHTEILADLTNSKDYAMLLVSEELKVIHVSTHISLREAIERVKKDRVLQVIKLADEAMRMLGFGKPRIVVAGLNPHAGEGGLFGKEEINEIRPAVEEARNLGYDVTGPLPPDTVFVRARGGSWDIVVAMYHDQGHIPLKLIGMQWDAKENKWKAVKGVNITVGLPIIRTSVDHGTAYGKAGKGFANHESMLEAIKYAAKMASYKMAQMKKVEIPPSG
jgi:4-hydroxythreonine-4-phosphate dehydrogenase